MQETRKGTEFPDQDTVVLVATAIVQRAKILVVREEDHPYNREWVLPQGYVKEDESLVDAARREVREELGIDVEILQPVGFFEDFVKEKGTRRHYVIICYLGRPTSGTLIQASAEVIDFAWVNPSVKFDNMPVVAQKMLKDAGDAMRNRRF